MLPEIIVTGLPHSGTSFMTWLVTSITGLSPGPAEGLKGADMWNLHGYWEYLPLRHLTWQCYRPPDSYMAHKCPTEPQEPNEEHARAIAALAEKDRVEVYKCFILPWIYLWYGVPRKAILINRRPRPVFDRYYTRTPWTWEEYGVFHAVFHRLATDYLERAWPLLWVKYEDFFVDTEKAIRQVCDFLERPYHKRLLSIFRPRRAQ